MADDLEFEMEFRASPVSMCPVGLETREGKPDVITGYASVFYDGTPGTEYDLAPGVKERIMPGAFDDVMRESHDVLGLFNHDMNYVLGRSGAGTLKLSVDSRGLRYEIDPPQTQVARDLKESLRRQDIPGSSFSFKPTKETFSRDGVNKIREIRGVRVYDVGPVAMPAYTGTTAVVSKRSMELLNAAEDTAAAVEIMAGEQVQWWKEEQDETSGIWCIEPKFGLVLQVKADGPLGTPGGSATVNGTAADPALLVQGYCDMDGDDEDYGLETELYLMRASNVAKVATGPSEGGALPDLTQGLSGTPNDAGRGMSLDLAQRKLRLRERQVRGAV